jgi:hypothetical protein
MIMSPYERMVKLTPTIVAKMMMVTLLTDIIVANLWQLYYRDGDRHWTVPDSYLRRNSLFGFASFTYHRQNPSRRLSLNCEEGK